MTAMLLNYARVAAVLAAFLLWPVHLPAATGEVLWDELNAQTLELYREGRLPEAAAKAEEAIAVAESSFGPDHPKTALSLDRLSAIYESQQKYGAALHRSSEALRIWKSQLGSNDPFVISMELDAARVVDEQASTDVESIRRAYEPALSAIRSRFGAGHSYEATALLDMADALWRRGEREAAAEITTKAMEILSGSVGTANQRYVETAMLCGDRNFELGRQEAALLYYRKAVDAARRIQPNDAVMIAGALSGLAENCRVREDFFNAEAHLKEALRLLEERGVSDPLWTSVLYQLRELYTAEGRSQEAAEMNVRAVRLEEETAEAQTQGAERQI
ncbi:MAG: tetratricopeptide repeat protein [Candidatus Omnitrophica bacterium]|nr:tetratricopeptide repeat protein [Candidatus Omnitrophota bacterium]